jgi:hypothetical protein
MRVEKLAVVEVVFVGCSEGDTVALGGSLAHVLGGFDGLA